jgi:hypothetical protein
MSKTLSIVAETAMSAFRDVDVLAESRGDDLSLLRLKLAPSYRFIFLLANNVFPFVVHRLHPDPLIFLNVQNPEKVHGWDIEKGLSEYFGGVIRSVSAFANISVETKVSRFFPHP